MKLIMSKTNGILKHLKTIGTLFMLIQMITACTEAQKVILVNEDGTKQLIYQCNDIQPQAESIEEITIIYRYVVEIGMSLQQNQKYATLQELTKGDIKTRERIIVDYLCERTAR